MVTDSWAVRAKQWGSGSLEGLDARITVTWGIQLPLGYQGGEVATSHFCPKIRYQEVIQIFLPIYFLFKNKCLKL